MNKLPQSRCRRTFEEYPKEQFKWFQHSLGIDSIILGKYSLVRDSVLIGYRLILDGKYNTLNILNYGSPTSRRVFVVVGIEEIATNPICYN